jgi:hypothetical protein
MYKVLPVDEVILPEHESHDDIVVNADNLSSTTIFKWQPADFGTPAAVEYSLYLIEGVSGEEKLVSSSFGDSLAILLSALNTVVLQAGATIGVENDIPFILKASISSAYGSAVSAPVFVKVTPFAAVPQSLHIIGNVLGDKVWNNANYEYIMFRDENLAANVYTSYFKAGGFKFILEEDLNSWNNLYGKTGDGILGNKTGSDITDITASGYYTVTVDLTALRYSITPYDASTANTYTNISLIGEFNGWGGDLDLVKTDYDPHIWIADDANLTAGQLKFRANHDWSTNWGAADQFPYGKGVGGGANIAVPEDGTYFVKFNDLTGHYVFYKK